MIGSHDSFTYLPALSSFINKFTRYWRTQNKTIMEQYKAGVRYFDIRVKREVDDNNKTTWRVCHGYAEFSKVFSSLKSICVYFGSTLKGSKFRIWLEKGTDEDWEYFKNEINPLIIKYNSTLLQVVRKSPETVHYDNQPNIEYYACNEWDFKSILLHPKAYIIKEYAEAHNPTITQEMIDDPNTIYFMDYATGTTED